MISLDIATRLLQETVGVMITTTDTPDRVRSKIGNTLAHRDQGLPSWWNGEERQTSPYRVFPDIMADSVHIVWLRAVDDDMRRVVSFLYPKAIDERYQIPPSSTGQHVIVEWIAPVYYSRNMRRYLERTKRRREERAPNLSALIPLVRQKAQTMLKEWADVSTQGKPVWYDDDAVIVADDNLWITELHHKAHANSHRLTLRGYVGQVLYACRDETIAQDAEIWMHLAMVWGIGSGTTWGWGTVWVKRFSAERREP